MTTTIFGDRNSAGNTSEVFDVGVAAATDEEGPKSALGYPAKFGGKAAANFDSGPMRR